MEKLEYIAKAQKAGIKIEAIAYPEATRIRGNALASGDDKLDKEEEERIARELDDGNEWAWCAVKVVASYGAIAACDWLGCCSYASKEEFIKNSGYYEDMAGTAIDNLRTELRNCKEAYDYIQLTINS